MNLRLICLMSAVWLAGCAGETSTTQPSNMRDRQDQAMRDPFHYSPEFDRRDISGGDITHFDRDGFGRDMHDVLSP